MDSLTATEWEHIHSFDHDDRALRQHLWSAMVPNGGHNVPSSVVSPVGEPVTGQIRDQMTMRAYHVGLHAIAEMDRRARLEQGDSVAGYGPPFEDVRGTHLARRPFGSHHKL